MTDQARTAIEMFAWFVLAFGCYVILVNRLAQFVQPLRLRLAKEGEELLADDRLPSDEREYVRFCVDHAFSVWPAVAGAVLFPLVILPKAAQFAWQGGFRRREGEIEWKTSRIVNLFVASLIAANPLFGAVVLAELIVALAAVILFTGQMRVWRRILTLAVRAEARPAWRWLRPAR